MTILDEGVLSFSFDANCEVTRYDQWSFYRNQFQKTCGGARAVDFLCLEKSTGWIIEVKDYRHHPRTKPSDLGDEVAVKVRDTLAGFVAASANATDKAEQVMAAKALRTKTWKVVLHLELPEHPSKLHSKKTILVNLAAKLKQKLKAIDAHPRVVDKKSIGPEMCWKVKGKV